MKTDVQNAAIYDREDCDIAGPICIGAKAQITGENGVGTLYVFTSSQIFTDNVGSAVSGNNKVLFSNIMSSVADHEVSVSIPAKNYDDSYLTASTKETYIFMAVTIVIIPLTLIITGLFIWIGRRKK